jgi:hypothetical protein
MIFMGWVILLGLIGIAANLAFVFYGKSPYRSYILFKCLCVLYATVAYSLYAVDRFWFDINWITPDNFRFICIRPLVVMLFTWFILDAYLRRWGRWRE